MAIRSTKAALLNWQRDRLFTRVPRQKFYMIPERKTIGAVTLCRTYDLDSLRGMLAIRMSLLLAGHLS